MRSYRSLAIGLALVCVAAAGFFRAPSTARASNALAAAAEIDYPFNYAVALHPKQTALKPGDAFQLVVNTHDPYGIVSVDADFSAFGVASATPLTPQGPSYATHAGLTFSNWFAYVYPPITVGTTTNGVKNIPVRVVDGNGDESAQVVSVAIDSTPPTLSLTALSFSTTSPQEGDQFLLSGSARDFGSALTLYRLLGDAAPATGSGHATGCLDTIMYGVDPIRAALASSTDGTFANVPIPIFECGNAGYLAAHASAASFTLVAYDGAGNMATSTVSASVPKPPPPLDSVLFIPGTEASRLYYRLPAGEEHQIWEPTLNADVAQLAMNPNDTSKNDVYVKADGIIGSFYGNSPVQAAAMRVFYGASGSEVYGDFENYMDSLVASSTLGMRQWRAYPYDWRYDVRSIVDNGTKTLEPDGTFAQVRLEDVIAQMASSSATGKVAIVAHSNGGLIAKALMQKLVADGKGSLVDKLVLVGTPQWGTPSDIGVMLHGDGQSYGGGIVMASQTARSVIHNLPDAYDLLPSAAYFAHVINPLLLFSTGNAPSSDFAASYGSVVTTHSALEQFLEDTAKLDANVGDASNIRAPLPLRTDLVDTASADHAALDSWTPPAGLSVTAVAGWGQSTVAGYAYSSASSTACTRIDLLGKSCTTTQSLRHTPIFTQDGDGTVVSPSAVGEVGDKYYFNTESYAKTNNTVFSHQNLVSAPPIENLLLQFFQGKTLPKTTDYVATTTPVGGFNPLTVISTHSPVNLLVTDASGNQSGVAPIPGTDFSDTVENIPGSSVFVMDDEEYVYVPQSGTYHATATGYASGAAAVEVGTAAADGSITTTQTFSSLPVISGTVLSLSVNGSTAVTSDLAIDETGSGTADATVAPGDGLASYAPPAPVPAEAPAGAGSGSGGGGAISIPYITPALVPTIATTTATTSVPAPEFLATSTPPVATSTTAVATSTAPVAAPVPPVPAPAAPTVSTSAATTTDLSQTAAAANALSQPASSGVASSLYHWVTGFLSSAIHFLAHIL